MLRCSNDYRLAGSRSAPTLWRTCNVLVLILWSQRMML